MGIAIRFSYPVPGTNVQAGCSITEIFFSDRARVAELVDALDLGSSIERCESSSLSFRTSLKAAILVRLRINK